MDNNALNKNYITCIHSFLNIQENIESKIDHYTNKLQAATRAYGETEKQLNQFSSNNINYHALSKALALLTVSLFCAYRLGVWLITLSGFPSTTILVLHLVLFLASLFGIMKYCKQSFASYKNNLEHQAMRYKNTIEQSRKNIDNRIRELHDIQQRLQCLWQLKNE